MLMVLADEAPTGERAWAAVKVEGIGRVLSREQAEAVAARTSHVARFLFPYTEQTAQFGREESPPTLAMLAGETIWHYGEPLCADMLAVLRSLVDGAESPRPTTVLLPVASVVAAATDRFGETDAHSVEAAFDAVVMSLGGGREEEPPAYHVTISAVLGIG
jgi:hypothetical protein